MLKPPLGAGLAPNGFATGAGAVLAPNGFAATPPKAGAAALVLPKGFATPLAGAAGAPNAGVELGPPKGLAPALAPKLELPPNGFADGALLAGNALVAALPNNDAPATVGDLLVSNGLIGSGVFGCSSAFDALPKTLGVDFVFTLNPPPKGFALAGLAASLLAPNTNPPLLAAAGALAPNEKPPLAAPLLAGALAPNLNAGALSGLLSLAAPVDVPNAGADAPPKLKPAAAGLADSLLSFASSAFVAVAPKVKAAGLGAASPAFAPPKVNGAVVAGVDAAGASALAPNVNAGAEADNSDLDVDNSGVFSTGFAPKLKGAAGVVDVVAAVDAAPPNVKPPLAGFVVSLVTVDPPNVNAGAGSGAFTGTFSGDLGGAPNVNVGALAGASEAFFSCEDPPKNASSPDSPAGFAGSAGFAGAVTPKENGAAPVDGAGTGAVDPNEKAAPLLAPAAGMPNENAGLSPAAGAGANGDGLAGAAAPAFSSSSIAAWTFF